MSESQLDQAKLELAKRVDKVKQCKQVLDDYKSNMETCIYVDQCDACEKNNSLCNNCKLVITSRCVTDWSLIYEAETLYRTLLSDCKYKNLLHTLK